MEKRGPPTCVRNPRPVSQGHCHFGFTRDDANGVWYREWAPGAQTVSLVGDFNGWDRTRHPLQRGEDGAWSLFLPGDGPTHGARVKTHVLGADGSALDRIPAYAQRVVQGADGDFAAEVWLPPAFEWRHPVPP